MERETVTVVETKRDFNYGYIIVGLSFLAMIASMGIRGTFGTFVTEWEASFSVNRVWISMVSFISLVVYGISVVFAGRLTDRVGPRRVLTYSMILMSICLFGSYFSTNIWHMMILYGIFGSIGFGFASNVTVSVAIVRWFKDKKGLMISLVVLGMAAGPMIYGPFNLFMIEEVGWRWLFVLYGAIYGFLFLPLFLFFFRDSPERSISFKKKDRLKTDEKAVQGGSSIFSILRHPITWLICLVYMVCGFTDVGLINTHLVPLGENRGFSSNILGNVLIVYGITNIIGTIFIGYISDKFSNHKLLSFLFLLRGFGLVMLLFLDSTPWLLVFALFYGFTDIATIAPFTVLCSQIFGEEQMGSSFGLISFFHQFGAALGSLIPGFLFSISSNYQSALWLCIALLVMNAVIFYRLKDQKRITEMVS